MKKVAYIIALLLVLFSTYAFAQMGGGMMGQEPEEKEAPYYRGWGMGPGMMHGWGMGPGMMYGWGQESPWGCDMMGPGMMYGWGYQDSRSKKFLDDTAELRRSLHMKRFEYMEALRNPQTTPEALEKLQDEMRDLYGQIYKMRWEKSREK